MCGNICEGVRSMQSRLAWGWCAINRVVWGVGPAFELPGKLYWRKHSHGDGHRGREKVYDGARAVSIEPAHRHLLELPCSSPFMCLVSAAYALRVVHEFIFLARSIDDMTMKITNPNVVGSGFISFPPQKPFEKPVFFQPPTVSVSMAWQSLPRILSPCKLPHLLPRPTRAVWLESCLQAAHFQARDLDPAFSAKVFMAFVRCCGSCRHF